MSGQTNPKSATVFLGSRLIASGPLAEVAALAREAIERAPDDGLFVFDDATGVPIAVDLRGTVDEVRARFARSGPPEEGGHETAAESIPPRRRSPGRPRLGVVGREVTLLPRHWEWLGRQPGGASVTLRKLVEHARRDGAGSDRRRQAQGAAHSFMMALAGDRPGFEEAMRALYAGDSARFQSHTSQWPTDVAAYAAALARPAFEDPAPGSR